MKSRLLLLAFLLTALVSAAPAQTFRMDWTDADSVKGPVSSSLKRNGRIVNLNGTAKNLLFRYDISGVAATHTAAMCFGDLCFFLWPGEDDPTLREAQYLAGGGSLKIYTLCNSFGETGVGEPGITTFYVTLFDRDNTSDSVRFSCTYIVGDVSSVPELGTLGLSAGPLPATDVVTITGEQARTISGADLYSANGTLLRTYGINQADQHSIDVTDLTSGTYHLVLTTTSGTVVRTPVVIVR